MTKRIKHYKNSGFSLLELMLALALMGALIGSLTASLTVAYKARARVDEGRRRRGGRSHRPRARRSAGALHPASRFLHFAGVIMATPLVVSEVYKSFTMHLQGGIRLPVVADVSFSLSAGECAVLGGPSGAGKSSILKMIYGSYAIDTGQVIVSHDGGASWTALPTT